VHLLFVGAVLQADGLAQSGDFFKVRRKLLAAFSCWQLMMQQWWR
jgi:hypothetical protein